MSRSDDFLVVFGNFRNVYERKKTRQRKMEMWKGGERKEETKFGREEEGKIEIKLREKTYRTRPIHMKFWLMPFAIKIILFLIPKHVSSIFTRQNGIVEDHNKKCG